ncbi:hypothetical protein CG379_06230 [Neisseria gonorrhoeae]
MPSEPLFRRHLFSLTHSRRHIAVPYYSGLNLNRYGVASPCPDLNLIHYTLPVITVPFLLKLVYDSGTNVVYNI